MARFMFGAIAALATLACISTWVAGSLFRPAGSGMRVVWVGLLYVAIAAVSFYAFARLRQDAAAQKQRRGFEVLPPPSPGEPRSIGGGDPPNANSRSNRH